MFKINALPLLSIAGKLEQMMTGANACATEGEDLLDELRALWVKDLTQIIKPLKFLQLNVSAAICERIITTYKTKANCKAFYADIKSLSEVFMRELETYLFFHVPSDKADFITQTNLFGQAVADNFPSANLDIEEAGKCIAFGRNTACVFHLMRVMEIGVKTFALGLGILAKIKTAQPSWGEVLRLTNEEIQRQNKGNDPAWTPDKRSFFENIQADLMTVKNAWRNTTMHVENIYDEERAEDIFNAVKGFMRHLAKHLDESGQFTP
jgi:hypothetical protein